LAQDPWKDNCCILSVRSGALLPSSYSSTLFNNDVVVRDRMSKHLVSMIFSFQCLSLTSFSVRIKASPSSGAASNGFIPEDARIVSPFLVPSTPFSLSFLPTLDSPLPPPDAMHKRSGSPDNLWKEAGDDEDDPF